MDANTSKLTHVAENIEQQLPDLQRYARALTHNADSADDLVQDCLERALRSQHSFRTGSNLRSWLFAILHNLHIDNCRRLQRQRQRLAGRPQHQHVDGAVAQEWLPEILDLEMALTTLSAFDRQIIYLAGLDDLSYGEIADRLDLALGTVKSRISRARGRLRATMDRELFQLSGNEQSLPGVYDLDPRY